MSKRNNPRTPKDTITVAGETVNPCTPEGPLDLSVSSSPPPEYPPEILTLSDAQGRRVNLTCTGRLHLLPIRNSGSKIPIDDLVMLLALEVHDLRHWIDTTPELS